MLSKIEEYILDYTVSQKEPLHFIICGAIDEKLIKSPKDIVKPLMSLHKNILIEVYDDFYGLPTKNLNEKDLLNYINETDNVKFSDPNFSDFINTDKYFFKATDKGFALIGGRLLDYSKEILKIPNVTLPTGESVDKISSFILDHFDFDRDELYSIIYALLSSKLCQKPEGSINPLLFLFNHKLIKIYYRPGYYGFPFKEIIKLDENDLIKYIERNKKNEFKSYPENGGEYYVEVTKEANSLLKN